jgi:pyruvate/2-oxoglutarate/acetoin dehydrogenase E1 component
MEADPRVIIIGEDVEANVYGTMGRQVARRQGRLPADVRTEPHPQHADFRRGDGGGAIGAAMTGLRPIVDLSYSTFLYMAMDQFVNQVAKNRYMFGGQARFPSCSARPCSTG